MAFLPVDLQLPQHRKTLKFKRRHGPGSWLHIIGLWMWTALYRPDGDLAGMDDEEIELAAEWHGTEGAFVTSMRDCGFLDGERGSYRVHDWAHWQAFFNDQKVRIQNKLRKRSQREREKSRLEERTGEDRRVEEKRGSRSSAPLSEPRTRKKLSEQDGLIGDIARAERELSGREITPTGEQIIAFHKKRKANDHLRDSVFVYVYREVWRKDAFWAKAGWPFGAFVQHFDDLLGRVVLTQDDYVDPLPIDQIRSASRPRAK